METIIIKNISQYLEAMRDTGFPLIYRGQEKDWPLIPSIGRLNITYVDGLLEIEEAIIKKLQQYGYSYFQTDINMYSDWILHAQHYGLPMRLLDFTTNPLKALYFAVDDSQSNFDGVVWALDMYPEDTFPSLDLDSIEFYSPVHINNRIAAQESAFAVFPLKRNDLDIQPLDAYEKEFRFFHKFSIPSACKTDIKKELSILGINKMSIYPGIDGIVEKVKEEASLI